MEYVPYALGIFSKLNEFKQLHRDVPPWASFHSLSNQRLVNHYAVTCGVILSLNMYRKLSRFCVRQDFPSARDLLYSAACGMLELRKLSSLPPHIPVRCMTLVPAQCKFPLEPQPDLPEANTVLRNTLYLFLEISCGSYTPLIRTKMIFLQLEYPWHFNTKAFFSK